MQYICLRDCYVNDVYWKAGETYNLPENMQKSEKNFKPVVAVEIPKPQEKQETFNCRYCGRQCKNEFGKKIHEKACSKKK